MKFALNVQLFILLHSVSLLVAAYGRAEDSVGESKGPEEKVSAPSVKKNLTNNKSPQQQAVKAQSSASAEARKGQVQGIIGESLRLSCENIPTIAAKQIYIVEGKEPGQMAARIEITGVSKSKKLAGAKVLQLESGFLAQDLIKLYFYGQEDFKTRKPSGRIADFVAPPALQGRNPWVYFAIQTSLQQSIAANIVTGSNLNQSSNSFALDVVSFLPMEAGRTANRMGINLNYAQTLPTQVVARVVTSNETQTLSFSASKLESSLLFRFNYDQKSLARLSLGAGYQIVDNKIDVESSTGTGNTKISFKHKGPIFGLEGDFSPLPFLYLGLQSKIGIPQTYTATDSENQSALSGKWNNTSAAIFGELRYPIGSTKTSTLILNLSGGAIFHQIETKIDETKSAKSYISPEIKMSFGYGAG